ncbi:Signal transduction protein containing GAF and PtsI domain [Lunatimonas lonarensis]|uniref:Signal transduction protein containing GAF and PtsI domain n=2 Tax=Lunatimonas lonarensis TaxID=1232681 RepID=R7ZRM7_9BACT|nr:Signal transduction protein containing GAF and PtsI domain [Lunatimonas lonarensis]
MTIEAKIDQLIELISDSSEALWGVWLGETLACFGCSTGTIHTLENGTTILRLQAHVGVPDFLLPKMSEVPIGKGMAGIAAERKQAVQVCNLQTDDSGVVRPGAKDTKVEGAITVPLLFNGELYGTLGIAKKEPYEFTDEEVSALMRLATSMAQKVA